MAEDIITKYSNLKLSSYGDEEAVVDLRSLGVNDTPKEKVSLTLVGRVVTNKSFNLQAFKRTILQAWGVAERAQMRPVENGLFTVHFLDEGEKRRVLEGRPWCFDNQLVLVEEITGSEQPSDVTLTHSPFWVQVCDLPFDCRGKEEVQSVASRVGRVVVLNEAEFGWDKCCRARVEMDVTKPLKRRQKIVDKQGREKWVGFRYERLPKFCFCCGIIGHVQRDCSEAGDVEEGDGGQLWGAWLKATTKRVTRAAQGEGSSPANSCGKLDCDNQKSWSGGSSAASRDCSKDTGGRVVVSGPLWSWLGSGNHEAGGGVW